jgi:hypothetical protein
LLSIPGSFSDIEIPFDDYQVTESFLLIANSTSKPLKFNTQGRLVEYAITQCKYDINY